MPAPDNVLKLIENFDRNIESYKNQSYNEAQLRRKFIDPFFEALGEELDTDNERYSLTADEIAIIENSMK